MASGATYNRIGHSGHLVFFPNFGPHHVARIAALSKALENVVGIEFARKDHKYPWRIDPCSVGSPTFTLSEKPLAESSNQELAAAGISLLREKQPAAVVVTGYSHAAMREITRFARRQGSAVIMTTTTTAFDKPRKWLLEQYKRWWCQTHYDALFLAGERSVEYFARLGFPRPRIWKGYNTVDNAHFAEKAEQVSRSAPEAAYDHLPAKFFLCVSRLSPEKNLVRLLEAYALYRAQDGSWGLVIVGDGPQDRELKSRVRNLRLTDIHFVPWQHYDELPAYYALASALVLPSVSEPWGLVVNEAMACGLPVLVSRNCGCLPELCWRGVNGFDFDPYDIGELSGIMARLSDDTADLSAMADAARNIIAAYSLENWASALKDCILTTLQRKEQALHR